MPGSILNADTQFPQFYGWESTDEKLEILRNYLLLLYEQLRYCLSSIGTENFTDGTLQELQTLVTKPVYLRLEEAQGGMTALSADLSGLMTRVEGAEGSLSRLSQTADMVRWLVADGDSESSFTLTSRCIAQVAQQIDLSGVVRFTDLAGKNSYTQIDGGNIRAGSAIAAPSIYGGSFYDGQGYGSMHLEAGLEQSSFVVKNELAEQEALRVEADNQGEHAQSRLYLEEKLLAAADDGGVELVNLGGLTLLPGCYGSSLPAGHEGMLFFLTGG